MLCSSGWSEWHPAEKTFDMEGCVNLKYSIDIPVAFANSIRAALDTFHPSKAAQAGTHLLRGGAVEVRRELVVANNAT